MKGTNNGTGFAGLSSLGSDVDKSILDGEKSEKPASPPPQQNESAGPGSSARSASGNAPSTARPAASKPATSPAKSDAGKSPSASGPGATSFWTMLLISGLVVFGAYVSQSDKRNDGPAYTSAPSDTGRPPAVGAPAPLPKPNHPRRAPERAVKFIKPPVGTSHVHSIPEIRWCLREDIRIEDYRRSIHSNADVDRFNRIVDERNKRCASFRYRTGTLERARRDVEAIRSQIVAEASGNSWKPPAPTSREVPAISGGGASVIVRGLSRDNETLKSATLANRNSEFAAVYEAQSLLRKLRYDPGPVDGIYGEKTRAAIKLFEESLGREAQGDVTDEVLASMRIKAGQ